MQVVHETKTRCREVTLGIVEAEFAGQVATSVWLGTLTEDAAREAFWSYALACCSGKRRESRTLCETLMAEYRRRRTRQDACG